VKNDLLNLLREEKEEFSNLMDKLFRHSGFSLGDQVRL